MYNVISILLGMILLAPADSSELKLGEKSVLIYENTSQVGTQQFVMRLARLGPDIVFEWESLSHQGTVHLYKKAVAESRKFLISSMFDPGVDIAAKDQMTKWLSVEIFDDLKEEGQAEFALNRMPVRFKVTGETTFKVNLDREAAELSAIQLRDSRDGEWLFLNDRNNPLLLEYKTPFYSESLVRVSTEGLMALRWFQSIPPVK